MWGRRITYLGFLFGSVVFYCFYREWFSWFFMVALWLLPVFSILVSLPAMLTVKATLRCPDKVRQDMPVRTSLELSCKLPTPPVRCQLRVVNMLTGERYLGDPGERIPTEHCGHITVTCCQFYVYDYLGLFRRQLKKEESCSLLVMPKPVPGNAPLQRAEKGMGVLRPKPGGGFSEIHDLRLYRPGDELRQIHWKMSAKVGKLIYREPMEPVQRGYVLNIALSGTSAELDKKLGKLLWTSSVLLESDLEHTVRAMTGKGLFIYEIKDRASQENCIQSLLCSSLTEASTVAAAEDALWQHSMGGDGDEK